MIVGLTLGTEHLPPKPTVYSFLSFQTSGNFPLALELYQYSEMSD